MSTSPRRCTVYRAHDQHDTVLLPADESDQEAAEIEEADRVSVRSIMTRELVCARRDLEIAHVTDLIVRRHIGCLPIVDEHCYPIGIITRTDLAEQLNVAMRTGRDSTWSQPIAVARVAEDIMMPLMFSLNDSASMADAAALMTAEDTHHVLILNAERVLVGVVSSKDIMSWVARRTARARSASVPTPPSWRPVDG